MAKININNNLDYYGYREDGTSLISQKKQEEQKQEKVDLTQNVQIDENKKINYEQEAKIEQNTAKIEEVIKIIEGGIVPISGGTYDAGEWS